MAWRSSYPNFIRKVLFTISVLFILNSCSFPEERVKDHWWKYGSGYPMGDELIFDSTNLRNDTIFNAGKPYAVIVSKITGYLGDDNELVIQSLPNGEKASYHEK